MIRPFEIGAKIVQYSISSLGNIIITYEIRLPKWLLAEFNTHKIEIERNSASSRAVPTKIILEMIQEYPVMPWEWRYNASGMAPQELMSQEDEDYSNTVWLEARDAMLPFIDKLQHLPSGRSADKQRVNRLLEPWMGTVVVCTMTGGGGIGMNNFFGLRDHDGVQPEFRHVARQMHDLYHNEQPTERLWHLPYIDFDRDPGLDEINYVEAAIRSSARCGRVTHYRQGEERSFAEDLSRGKSFATSGHFSPLRHASRAGKNQWYGNMYGWMSISKIMMEHDYITACCELSKKK